jgi:hypothetical protein
LGNERRRSEKAKLNSSTDQATYQLAEEVDEEEEDEKVWQSGQNFVAVESVKPAMATLYLHVMSVPKAKKKAKKRSK